jgi:hypothetical protein
MNRKSLTNRAICPKLTLDSNVSLPWYAIVWRNKKRYSNQQVAKAAGARPAYGRRVSPPALSPLRRPLQSQRLYGVALLVALVAGASCIDPSGPKDWVCTSDETLAVTVGPGPEPRISWTPECTAFVMFVADSGTLDDFNALWVVLSKDTVSSQVPASVIYGTLPPNTMEVVPPEPLEAGHAYMVFVTARQGPVIGLTYFTP